MKVRRAPRGGATLVEAALVYPVMFLIVFAILMLGIGVFRQQQLAHLTRETSRWLSVHGTGYYKDTKQTVPTQTATRAQVYNEIIAPQAGGSGMAIPLSDCTIQWLDSTGTPVANMDATTVKADGTTTANRVSVNIVYTWNPGIFFFGPMNLASTSVCTMAN